MEEMNSSNRAEQENYGAEGLVYAKNQNVEYDYIQQQQDEQPQKDSRSTTLDHIPPQKKI